MKVVKLKKTYSTNTDYKTGIYDALIIERIGASVDVSVIKIDGREIAGIDSVLQPTRKHSDNLFGPFDLKDLYLVIPPSKPFRFESSASGKVVVEGKHIILEPGEGVPSDVVSRYGNQDKTYYTPFTLSTTLPANASIAPGASVKIGELVPSRIERYIFDNIAGFSITNYNLNDYGILALRFVYDGRVLDSLETTVGPAGIDAFEMPLPPRTTTNMEPFSFEEFPLVVEPNHKLEIYAVNISGSSISPPSGQSLTLTFEAMVRKTELE